MNESVSKWQNQLTTLWERLSATQRTILMFAGGTFVIAIVLFSVLSSQVDYQTAFSGLSQEDAGAIANRLKEAKIPYELADNGATIKVPAPQVAEVRLQLASEGLPKGGSAGYELFDQSTFGLTDFAQRLNYQRALEGELSRTINEISAVAQSRVHIVLPEEELYTTKENVATASVVLKLRPGGELRPDQIRGITNLVAGSVEGLKPENVTILDSSGVTLSDGVSSPNGLISQATATQLDMQASYQSNLERQVQSLLEPVLGQSKAAIKVNAVMDWDQTESNTETYTPAGTTPQPRSSQQTLERYGGTDAAPIGGIPGVSSNIPYYAGITSTLTTGTISGTVPAGYERIETTNNYELSKVVSHTIKAPGAVKRLSVAVILDNITDQAQIDRIESIVASAVGLDSTRGDTITVASMPFDRTFAQEQAQAFENSQQMASYLEYGKIAAIFLAFLIGLFFVRSLAKGLKPRPEPIPQAALPSGSSIIVTKPDDIETQKREAELHKQLELEEASRKRTQQQQQIANLTKAQPAAVAGLVKAWLDEK